ncbi:Oidioi.mRNA.OKI2018_I69.XSR.g16256.t1.cds [Oikopleura dioica]|uniref:Oidioi.mRNA.OKI2018_I69.PAR.g10455.t1.cds n=1 Tax=Oikopleura dioica TaxID=34765 RepID=A0ABN7RU96_OIKDI|nr:Oidioi.mRNA.OKI2018_I69.PAR.g10455.t1.cds [Oikopleura dioica]CAG5084806.1 Oidioi.mRNA.OKI2018_I69.PAR.g10741.t1.cds [Oikopleura dioica]CAG5099106.1 Oidioi.mRNA.OKI2018_I69.XSR.g16256.t1.cds [Oikopleura dioica]
MRRFVVHLPGGDDDVSTTDFPSTSKTGLPWESTTSTAEEMTRTLLDNPKSDNSSLLKAACLQAAIGSTIWLILILMYRYRVRIRTWIWDCKRILTQGSPHPKDNRKDETIKEDEGSRKDEGKRNDEDIQEVDESKPKKKKKYEEWGPNEKHEFVMPEWLKWNGTWRKKKEDGKPKIQEV